MTEKTHTHTPINHVLFFEMKQSRLDTFFQSTTSSSSSSLSLKRLSNDNEEKTSTEKIKRLKSDENHEIKQHFSLNQFYLEKFLMILSSAMKHHRNLFETNEFDLFEKYQQLPCSNFHFFSFHLNIYLQFFFYSVSSQIVFIRLLMRQCKWLRHSTINYELADVDSKTDYLTPLVQIGLLQDSRRFEIELIMIDCLTSFLSFGIR